MNRVEVPLAMVLAGRTIGEPHLSPDGHAVVFAARWGAAAGLFIVAADGGPEHLLTVAPPPQIGRGSFGGMVAWLDDGTALVYVATDGNIWRQPAAGGPATLIADTGDGRSASGLCTSDDGKRVAASIDLAEIWAWPLDGGAGRRIDDAGHAFVNDPAFAPGGHELLWQAWDVPDMAWDAAVIVTASLDDDGRAVRRGAASIQQPRPLRDGRLVSVCDDTGWLNVSIDGVPVVDEPYEHASATWGSGQRSFAVSPDESRVAYWRNEAGFGTLNIVGLGGDRQPHTLDRGSFSHLDWRGDHLVAIRSGARTPPELVIYDFAGPADSAHPTRRVLAVGSVAGWQHYELPEPDLVTCTADDGTELYARRYASRSSTSQQPGRTIVWVHGGPTDQMLVDWNPRLAYWWSRGYDCVVVDPRGTTGHGRAYQRALNGNWGALDTADTAALIRHVHDQGWATPATTVVTGGSAGGLTVVAMVQQFPDLVCGGVARYPVTDLAILAEKSHRFEAHYTDTLVAPNDGSAASEQRYIELSPISHTQDIARPVLIFHGDADPVVPVESSRRFAELAQAGGADVELVVFDGEGHGFRHETNQIIEYELTAHALQRWMRADNRRPAPGAANVSTSQ